MDGPGCFVKFVCWFVCWMEELGVDEPLVDVLLPLALDDLDVLRVPRLDRAHERFRLATTSHTTSYISTPGHAEKKSTHLPIAFPV